MRCVLRNVVAVFALLLAAAGALARGDCLSLNRSLPDTDRDGIADVFELYGCRYGDAVLDLPALGANPLRKNIFVELDVMTGATMPANALDDVIAAFRAAPVLNPDGTTGIDLVVDASGTVPFARQTRFSRELSIADNFVNPRTAVSPNGQIVVAWQDDRDGNDHYDVYARRFDEAGVPTTDPILVNRDSSGQQRRPAVAINDAGDFVVAWEDDRDGNGYYDIMARAFESGGRARSDELTINVVSDGHQVRPSIAMDGAGNWTVVWQDDRDGNGYYDVFARRFERGGKALSGEILVNQVSAGQQHYPQIAMASDGRAVVVWEDDQDGNDFYEIIARRLNPDATPNGNQFTVNQVRSGQELKPAIAMNATGNFAVAWEDDQDGNGYYEILARVFDAAGSPVGSQFTANEVSDGQQRSPSVAINGHGAIAVAWEDDQDGNGFYEVMARTFDANGAPTSGNATVNAVSSGHQIAASVGLADSGTYSVVWQDGRESSSRYSIFMRLSTSTGAVTDEVPVHDQVVTYGRLRKDNFAKVREGFFHYGVFAINDIDGAGGWGNVNGDGFIMNQGASPSRSTFDGTLMHELGHNLGLLHGGDERRNYKPNYLSVMNYRYSFGVDTDCDAVGDDAMAFSDGRKPQLNESSLNELDGICNGVRAMNALSSGQSRNPGIGVADTGSGAVVWQDDRDGNGVDEVFARPFDSNGVPIAATDIRVHPASAGEQGNAAVGVASDGRFVVAWQEDQDGDGADEILARRFDPTGAPVSSVITVNQPGAGRRGAPDISVSSDGFFVVAWEDDHDGYGKFDIAARLFDANGAPVTDSIRANSVSSGQQRRPRVSMAVDRRFVVVWEDDRDEDGFDQVFARPFTFAAEPTGGEIAVNAGNAGQRRPDVGMSSAGQFVVVWEDDPNKNGSPDIGCRRFAAAGFPLGAAFRVNQASSGQRRNPRVHANAVFQFAVVWQDDRDNNGYYEIFARPFSSDGGATSDEFSVNLSSSRHHITPDVAIDSAGNFATVWADGREENGYCEISAHRFGLDGSSMDRIAIDWDGHGSATETSIAADINDDDTWNNLKDYNDWGHILLRF